MRREKLRRLLERLSYLWLVKQFDLINFMIFKKYFIEILKLTAKPLNIIYPLPILQLLVFSQANLNVKSFFYALAFSFTFYPAVNLWNHINDVKEDILAGKYNVFAESNTLKIIGIIIVLILYSLSFLIVIKYSNQKFLSIILFTICLAITWLYSDRLILGKFIRRFKDHHITELFSFIISYISFTILLWMFSDDICVKSFALSISVLFFVLFGVFLKDIRDVSGDEKAGLKTLGVVFSPKTLVKLAVLSITLYYSSLIIFTIWSLFDPITLLALTPIILFLHSTWNFTKNNWLLSSITSKHIRRIMLSNISSIILFIISGFLSQALLTFQ